MIRAPHETRPSRLRRLLRREEGVVAIEFALVAPMLALFLVGTTSATQGLWANGKVAQASSVVGDLIAQETELDATSFAAIMRAAPVILEPFPQGDLSVRVRAAIACHEDPTDTADSTPEMFVVWSNGWAAGSITNEGPRPGSPLEDPPTDVTIQDGDYIILTTVSYTYEPAISQSAGHRIEMGRTAYHQPRDELPVTYVARQGVAATRNCADLMNR